MSECGSGAAAFKAAALPPHSPDERFAYVNNTLSGSVSVIDLASNDPAGSFEVTTIPLPPDILNGKRLFNTSNRIEMAKDRWIACAGCHFDGGTDGRTWYFADGRNTPALFGVITGTLAGESGVVIVPSDPAKTRLNIGLRSLDTGAAMTITLRRSNSAVKGRCPSPSSRRSSSSRASPRCFRACSSREAIRLPSPSIQGRRSFTVRQPRIRRGTLRCNTRRRRSDLRALLAAALLVAATGVAAATAGTRSSPIAVTSDGRFVVAANPDSRSVSIVEGQSRAVVAEVKINGTPQTVAIAPGDGRAFVPTREGLLAVVDLAPPRLAVSIAIGEELFGAACDDARLYVSAGGASHILVFDRLTLRQVASVATEELPRGLALAGGKLYVTHFRSGRLSVIDTATLAVERVISTGADSNLSQAVWIDGARAWLPATRSNSTNQALLFDTTAFPIVSAVDLAAGENLPKERIAIDIADRPSNMPLDVAVTSGGKMIVVLAGSDDLSIIDLTTKKAVAHLGVGSNPRGVALSPDERVAYVNNTLSGSVSVIDVDANRVADTIDVTTIPLPANVLNGKRLFHTSNRTTLAKDRWISCATCHFDGGMDGRTWFFRDGPRNTPALFGVDGTLPLHWSGDLDELQDVENTIRVIQAGTGLADGPSNCEPACNLAPPNAGRSQDLDDLAAFMRALPSPLLTPQVDAAAVARGAALFAGGDCASCHPPPLYTDRAKHDVGTGGGAGERKGSSFDTPSLRGLADTAPYFHDGSAPTLGDVLRRHGSAPTLTDAQRSDLAELLRSIPFPLPKRRAVGR